MTAVHFQVLGVPKPQGSHRAFMAGGKPVVVPTGGADFATWRNAVAQAAHTNIPTAGPFTTAIIVELVFRFPMPAARPKKTRAQGIIPKATSPDLDKLVRTCLDAFQAAGLIANDSLVAQLQARKYEVAVGGTGVDVWIDTIEETP